MNNRYLQRSAFFACALLLVLMAVPLVSAVPAYGGTMENSKDAPLIVAIKSNNTSQVIALLRQGANPNTQYLPMTGQEMESALTQNTWPLRPKHMNLGKLETRRWSPVSALIVALDVTLDCPSDCSLDPRHSALIEALIAAGADVNARGNYGHTPLSLALWYNRRDIVALLLEHHADVFAKDDYGETALMGAANMGDAGLIRSLLKQGLKVNAMNEPGMTPLMFACYAGNHGDVGTVRVLLEHGADVNAKNTSGKTALALAKMYANAKIVSLLKKVGAK